VIFATGGFGSHVMSTISSVLSSPIDQDRVVPEVIAMRRRLEESSGRSSLKRGFGGLTDLEFLVQFLILSHAPEQPDLLRSNLWDAMDALHRAGFVPDRDHASMRDAYDFLRTVEARLRLVHNHACAELPPHRTDLVGMARRLDYRMEQPDEAVAAFQRDVTRHNAHIRTMFKKYVGPL
jgi:glutamate-ammonia-ligase adenylyltransferase